VVCPLTPRELPAALANLAFWGAAAAPLTGRLAPDESLPKLIYSFNGRPDQTLARALRDAFDENEAVRASFAAMEVRFCQLPPEKDVYLREGEVGAAPLGRKSGPNWLFYETMRALRHEAQFVFLMETDCQPLAPNWIRKIQRACALNQDAWIVGSHYCGVSALHWSIARHINGNALYHIGDAQFWDFLDNRFWPWLNAYAAATLPDLAYDCGWETWLNRPEMEDASSYDWVSAREILHRFRLSNFVVNIGGAAEQSGEYIWTREDIVTRFPGVAIVHGPVTDSLDHRRGPIGLGRAFVKGAITLEDNGLVAEGDLDRAGFRRSLWIVGEPLEPGHSLVVTLKLQGPKSAGVTLTVREPSSRVIGAGKVSGPGFGKSSLEQIVQPITTAAPFVRLVLGFHGQEGARVRVSDLKCEIRRGDQVFWRAYRVLER
jgi:hypothetical protein